MNLSGGVGALCFPTDFPCHRKQGKNVSWAGCQFNAGQKYPGQLLHGLVVKLVHDGNQSRHQETSVSTYTDERILPLDISLVYASNFQLLVS